MAAATSSSASGANLFHRAKGVDATTGATDEFVEAWSAADHRREEEDRHRRLGLVINQDDDDAGQSSRPCRRRGNTDQGCRYLPQPKEEPNDEEDDYAAVMYRRLGLGRGGNGDGY
ncbi:hypothetical protein QYE76_018706 [Lolium multiflorum]|uniref:Uncharacterized protein n=1 Tax=Lolium multiflorum TaxID=4521 RepID=A0AAD8QFP6_LOLMU|nr:hypothetical protein QYE76_018706 [Lolium multiflorum]